MKCPRGPSQVYTKGMRHLIKKKVAGEHLSFPQPRERRPSAGTSATFHVDQGGRQVEDRGSALNLCCWVRKSNQEVFAFRKVSLASLSTLN